MSARVAGIEAGGTKFVCAIGTGPDRIEVEERFPTTRPQETLGRVISFLHRHGPVEAVGVGTFGPCDPNRESPTFGFITSTPKPGWANVDFAGAITREFGVPVGFDTDVNAAALGECRWGAAQGLQTFLYLTIGTGVGGGGMVNGRLMHGLLHPEMGHILVPRGKDAGQYGGNCPFHGDCLEGLASGPALEARWGRPAFQLPLDHPAWELESGYLALALHSFIMMLSPQRIILGGGVMEQSQLYPLIHQKVRNSLHGYIQRPEVMDDIESYIVPPSLGNKSGMLGAIALAQQLLSVS